MPTSIIGLELSDFWAVVNAYIDNGEHGIGINSTRIKPDTKLISISSVELQHQGELPGLPALPGRSTCRWPPTPKRRCRR